MIEIEIKNLKNIKQFSIELPFQEGVYAITGENGVGKSTIFSALAQLVAKDSLNRFFKNDGNGSSHIKYRFAGKENIWSKTKKWKLSNSQDEVIILDGLFEGSLMFGSRFSDVHKLILNRNDYPKEDELRNADSFIIKNLGEILRDDENFYSGLKIIKTKQLAQKIYRFEGQPYFLEKQGRLISQFFMSSGELLLIGLLNFISEKIKRIKLRHNRENYDKSLILIDEIEIALHPSAQQRLLKFLTEISNDYKVCIYIATHSVQIIHNIKPNSIYHIQSNCDNNLQIIHPCYPAYVTRSLYTNDGFDFVLLVEDELAKYIVDEIITKHSLKNKRLIKILPCGGWEQVLVMHHEFKTSKLAGESCRIFSILDGDIKDECERKYQQGSKYYGLKKEYLPIKSIEKFLKTKLIDTPDVGFIQKLGDTYFNTKSLDSILKDYKKDEKSSKDKNGKGLFMVIKKCAEEQGFSDESFKNKICSFIYENEDFTSLSGFLIGLLGN
ncbi:AAA family ATPase [Anabaena sp. UHCC 0451]|uniref:AAA family ATPase n=1 Tax=Anabaena sp. UHCC 0451 TaxID=2055235 RepID=UPI002B21D068|nr:AAA family ATPase [Anabaena sp. UHCC 0451]MEA5579022.1 AAA family ATPase [Anabaena sp. UHCC 0451]